MTEIMQELMEEMGYLEKTDALSFPMVEKWKSLPSEWARFTMEVYLYALPIKVVVNGEDEALRFASLKISVTLSRKRGNYHA